MSFGIFTAGKKADVVKAVKDYAGIGDITQLERVKDLLLAELEDAPDGKVYVVEASGHHDHTVRSLNVVLKTYWQ